MDLTHQSVKLCILSKWTPQFEGYGFDLMTKKSGEGHYVSMVHEGGPAEATHLEAGDWLIEVNGINVEKLSHGEVIKLIKGSENGSVSLLLAPSKTDKWRKLNQISITSSHPDLVHYITPPYQGKLRTFLNGAIDRLSGKREQPESESSVYHRYSLPIPSGMSDSSPVDWSPTGRSTNGRADPIGMRRSTHGDGQLAGSLDEQRQREIAEWRDKSLEMLMANQVDQGEPEIHHHDIINENGVSIISPVTDYEDVHPSDDHFDQQTIQQANHSSNQMSDSKSDRQSDLKFESQFHADQHSDHIIHVAIQNSKKNRPISSNQEKVEADIHLTDNNSSQDNNSFIAINNNSDTNSQPDNNQSITSLTLLDGEFFARQCKMRKTSETADYGFKMDSLPSGGGHFLRSIEPTGPAGLAGIRQNDRLIEVNNVNVEYTDHDTVVNMIRKSPDCEVTLLVVDEKSYKLFKSRNIRIHHGAGVSLVRYCDHRGLQEPGYNFNRSISMGEETKKGTLYRRGLSYQSAGVSSDMDDSKDEKSNTLQRDKNVTRIDDDEDTRQSTSTIATSTTRSSKIQQRESRSSISDWSFGSLSDADRLNRGKTIIKVPDDAPRPRLCSITKSPESIFGFTLNTYEKGRIKLIAEIDKESPAEAAGLLQWDRVIEINGVNINIENHAQVTGRIEASGNRLHLLVLPENQYEWYERAGLVPKSNQSNVIYLSNTDVTRDSITIARSLENSAATLPSRKAKNGAKKSSSSSTPSKISSAITPSIISSTLESKNHSRTNDENEHKEADIDCNKGSITDTNNGDKIGLQQIQLMNTTDEDENKQNYQATNVKIGDRHSTINSMVQYNTIDEETTEAIYDHREAQEFSTLPLRKGKKSSFTKKLFKRSLFGSRKDKMNITGGSMSNLSVQSEIIMGETSSSQQFKQSEAKFTRSVTLMDQDEDDELPGDEDNNSVKLMVKKDLQEKSSVWSTTNNNYHNNNNNVITINGITGNQSIVITEEGQSESQLLEKLKNLSLRDIRQKSRSESKIQAYQRMSKLNFSQRIQHFEDL